MLWDMQFHHSATGMKDGGDACLQIHATLVHVCVAKSVLLHTVSQTFSKIMFKTDMRDEVINLQDYSAIIPFYFVKTNVCCMVCLRRFIIQPSMTDGGVCGGGGEGANNLLYYATVVHLCVVKSMYALCYVTCDLSFNL